MPLPHGTASWLCTMAVLQGNVTEAQHHCAILVKEAHGPLYLSECCAPAEVNIVTSSTSICEGQCWL